MQVSLGVDNDRMVSSDEDTTGHNLVAKLIADLVRCSDIVCLCLVAHGLYNGY